MNRREFLVKSSQLAAASKLTGQLALADDDSDARPNIIWLVADQWRAQAIGVNGDPNVSTPNVDRLAISGVNFQNARSGFPLCSPFRGTMLTGIYPHHMVPGHDYPLPKGQKTIADVFNDAGYHTGYFGKWHLDGFCERYGSPVKNIVPPDRRGNFQTWIGYENNNSQWDTWVHGGSGESAFQYKLPGYEADSLTDLFLKHIQERGAELKTGKGKPFFAVLSIQPPHNPYMAPAEYMGRFNAEKLRMRTNVPPYPPVEEKARQDMVGYYAQIENWDWNIGRILDALNQQGIYSNTHIMIFADHGTMMGSHGQWLKENPFEEAVRIPMVVSGYRSFYGYGAGNRDTLFSAVDIAPTTLGLCGLTAPDWMQGHDYSSRRILSKPHQPDPDSVYLEVVKPSMHSDSIDQPYRGLVTQDGWKYVCFQNQSWLMFNLNEDPYEVVNLAFNTKYKQERAALINRLKQWVVDTKDQFSVPDPEYPPPARC